MEVNGGVSPQPSSGVYNTILKELGREKKHQKFKKKALTGRHVVNTSILNPYLTKSGDLEMTC